MGWVPGFLSELPGGSHRLALALLALLLTLGAGWTLARSAHRLGLLDLPSPRKIHARPTPRTGGLALCLGLAATLGLAAFLGWRPLTPLPWQTLAAGAGFLATGALDDRFSFHPKPKLFVLLALAALAAWPWCPGGEVHLGSLTLQAPGPLVFAFLTFWFLAVPTAVNIEDAVNGYMGGYTLLLAAAAARQGLDTWAILGALGGFLLLNWPRATHFLGDAGSLGCGFLLAELLLRMGGRQHPLFALVLTAPLSMDVAMGLVRRRRRGLGPLTPDRLTLPHRLMEGLDRGDLLAAPLLWLNALVCLLLASRPPLAALYLGLFGAALVRLNRSLPGEAPGNSPGQPREKDL